MTINNVIFGNCVYGNYMINEHIRPIICPIGCTNSIKVLVRVCESLTDEERSQDDLFIINSSLTDDGLFTGDLVRVSNLDNII